MLYSDRDDLRDLALSRPVCLKDAEGGAGIRLERWLGAGGMGAVFEAHVLSRRSISGISSDVPSRLALKVMRPDLQLEAVANGLEPLSLFTRERIAFERIAARCPPTDFVLAYYGSGQIVVVAAGLPRELPFLAIELIEPTPEGVTLAERIQGVDGAGVDPVRALRLLRGVIEGTAALHDQGVVHRDIKPDNVLVAGPVDDELPKVADYGIARVAGLVGTIAAMTPAYCGPEQALSHMAESNPLVGPWSDVHALSALAWFVLGGEHWCRSRQDSGWIRGERRSLRTAARLHVGFARRPSLLESIDRVLAKGAAPRPPDAAFGLPASKQYERNARFFAPTILSGEARFATVTELATELLPLLEDGARGWRATASRSGQAATTSRLALGVASQGLSAPSYRVRIAPLEATLGGDEPSDERSWVSPGGVVYQADGQFLMRRGGTLLHFNGDRGRTVSIPVELEGVIRASRWLCRGPGGGTALVGPTHLVLLRDGRFVRMALPVRPSGGLVGEIQAVVGGGDLFGVVTAETEDANGGAELWVSMSGKTWEPPTLLPLGGDVLSVSSGPYGFLATGARSGRNARALFRPFGAEATVYGQAVNTRPPLVRGLCGPERECWAAGSGLVLSLEQGLVSEEAAEDSAEPVSMGLDVAGVPWLLTANAVLERQVEAGIPSWRARHRRPAGHPRFVALGFLGEEICVVDEHGGTTRMVASSGGETP